MATLLCAVVAAGLLFEATSSENASAQDGEVGLVVSQISYAFSDDFSETGACPSGLSLGSIESYQRRHPAESAQQPGEADPQYRQRMRRAGSTLPSGENICLNPQTAGADPTFQTVAGGDVQVYGVDLDARPSRATSRPAAGTCAHEDFLSRDGVRGVDNQFFRVMGCVHSYQPMGAFNSFGNEMREGAWGILIALKGVDNRQNDPDVEVELFSNADPLQVDGAREAVPFASYVAENNQRFSASTRGRIVNGVLTTDPVDYRFRQSVHNYGIELERELHGARVQLTFAADGSAQGFLAGYTPIDHLYANQFSYTAATGGDGSMPLEQLQTLLRDNIPQSHGYTCNGVYAALMANADGDRDPQTGRCGSISIQYRVSVVPAFILRVTER